MGAAFDNARQQAECVGMALTHASRAAMAGRILAAVEQGERDLSRLAAWALHGLDPSKFAAPAEQISSQDASGEGLSIGR
jgi:hypothetical protein